MGTAVWNLDWGSREARQECPLERAICKVLEGNPRLPFAAFAPGAPTEKKVGFIIFKLRILVQPG